MRSKLVPRLLAAALLLATAVPAPALAADPDLDAFDAYVQRAVDEWTVPGLSIAIVHDGEVVFAKAYGVARAGDDQPFTVDTLSSIGSTTKAIAAAGVALLVDEGELDWDDRVIDHLPDFRLHDPYATREVRVRDLLTHNAGLPNTDVLWYEQERSTEEIVAALRHVEPAYSLRSSFVYQNVMYAAAGELTEAVSGMPWPDFVERRIFAPLGMERSVATLARTSEREDVASPHWLRDGTLVPIENASVDSVPAAGSIWSSAREMAEWLRFLLAECTTRAGETLLEPDTCAELFRPQVVVDREMYPSLRLVDTKWLTYGLGWFQTDYFGRPLDFHTGSIDGLVALAALARGEGLGIYVLANRDHAELRHALVFRALDLFGAGVDRDWSSELRELYASLANGSGPSAESATDSERIESTLDLATLAGSWSHPWIGTIEIETGDGADEATLRFGRRTGHLEHRSGDTWSVDWNAWWRGEGALGFTREGGSVVLHYGGVEWRRTD